MEKGRILRKSKIIPEGYSFNEMAIRRSLMIEAFGALSDITDEFPLSVKIEFEHHFPVKGAVAREREYAIKITITS